MEIFVFLFGVCIGSFINVVVYRLPRGLNFITGRSYCPKCDHYLSYFDLFPVLSFILLKGRCRYCHCKISLRYPLIELISGIIAIHCYSGFQVLFEFLFVYSLSMILLTISLIDFDTMIIPDELIVCLILLIIPSYSICDLSMYDRIAGLFIISLPMYLCNYIVESFGGGDIKLISVLGFILGYQNILIGMYIAFLLGGFYALILFFKNKNIKGKYIAFGPFICLGIYISLLFNESITNFLYILFSF